MGTMTQTPETAEPPYTNEDLTLARHQEAAAEAEAMRAYFRERCIGLNLEARIRDVKIEDLETQVGRLELRLNDTLVEGSGPTPGSVPDQIPDTAPADGPEDHS